MDETAKLESRDQQTIVSTLALMGIETAGRVWRAGANFFTAILAVEDCRALTRRSAFFVDVQNTLVNNAFIRWGTDQQKQTYLTRLASEHVGAYALSEPGSGSDAFAMQTRAVDAGDHYVLNGRKLWITNGIEAEIFVLFANANPEAVIAASRLSSLKRASLVFQSARRKTNSASALRRRLS
jgi:alkylation response protein AidB-like acyl-CoA dehydrogenase